LIRPAVGRLRRALIIYDEFLASTEKGFTMSQSVVPVSLEPRKLPRSRRTGITWSSRDHGSAKWPYAYFETENTTGTTFEIYDDSDFAMPESEESWSSV
jgi:hypothetical protein